MHLIRANHTMQPKNPHKSHFIMPTMLLVSATLAVASATNAAPPSQGTEFFETSVRPLIVKNCLACHSGPMAKGGLALDTAAGFIKGGASGAAISAKDVSSSLLLRAVRHANGVPAMPPGAMLTASELQVLTKWIEMGAPYPAGGPSTPHVPLRKTGWALQPIKPQSPPIIPGDHWSKTPIDRYILATLTKKGLKPSPEADKRTLLRRAVYDLTGLPPTEQQTREYMNDTRPAAYARLIDRLLASPAYGERWGRHWLDVVHYGDTHGYDKDKKREHAWPYRDYVIAAFNSDKPYSRFIKEQVAGDVLFPDNPQATIATGMLAAGPWDFVGNVELAEGTVEKDKTRLIDRDDMVATVISTFNSVTIHCARCHDHKFDPINQRDYYRLQAVFSGIDRGDRPYYDRSHMIQGEKLRAKRAALVKQRDSLDEQIKSQKSAEITQMEDAIQSVANDLNAIVLPAAPVAASPSNGFHSDISDKADVSRWVQIDLGTRVPVDHIRILPARPTDFADTPGFGFPVRYRVAVSDTADFSSQTIIRDETAADVPNPGDSPVIISLPSAVEARYVRLTATRFWKRTGDYVFALAEMQVISGNRNAAAGCAVTADQSIEAGRWSVKFLTDGYDSRFALLDLNTGGLAALQVKRDLLAAKRASLRAARIALLERMAPTEVKLARDSAILAMKSVDAEIAALPAASMVYAAVPHEPRPIWLLKRGDVEQKGELLSPGALSCMVTQPSDLGGPGGEGQARGRLAAWLASPQNTLTWRSIVNRVWQHHFTRGIVETPNDFGNNGGTPSHPHLLDWLASWFLQNGQSIKSLHRLIMNSAVYRQSSDSATGAAGNRLDADNRLLWRMNRRRLEAEEIRDSILSVSGSLNTQAGGPGFEPFRFKDDHSPIYDYSAADKQTNPAVFRRTVYEFIVRSVPDPFLETLDAADPNALTPVRNTTLTPLQALTMRNDPFVIRQSEQFAARLEKAAPTLPARIDLACRLIYGRNARHTEQAALASYAQRNGLANMCRMLINTNEFVFVD